MNSSDDTWEEDRLAELLALSGRDAPRSDESFLARLRARSAEVFAAGAAEEAGPSRVGRENRDSPRERLPGIAQRRHRMLTLGARVLSAALAATILVAVTLFNAPVGDDSSLAFSKVLERTAGVETLKLKIVRQGKTSEVFARHPQQLRWNDPDGTYRIARGSQAWQVDEKANRATPVRVAYFAGEAGPLDLLALVSLPAEIGAGRLAAARPVEQFVRDGQSCLRYRIEAPCQEGKVQLEAVVDAGTQMLDWLEVKHDRGGRVEPLARLEVVSLGQPVAEELFVVGDTLTEDGRVGKLTDLQGTVLVKPQGSPRWTPLDRLLPVHPGDWLRTDLRGANAVRVRLARQVDVTLGPGTLVELAAPTQVRLLEGEVQIAGGPKSQIRLFGPRAGHVDVAARELYRVDKEALARVEKEPLWLKAFEGRTASESIGSLVAKVDGRNVPLTVGYHKVSVDVRDQIARTVIEESFVNHTAGDLEGVFHFPLPAGASISGFGMWIGDKLVEADVVEKQRAREIFETILREKRDPALLEWTGGNIFKARVFPIFAHSEKRIKLTYTQVLPLRGNQYRYQYALQSDMLKQNPLRELSIDVSVSSAAAMGAVSCPTHPARISRTAHSARVEFTAQEYTPARDFEVVVQVDRSQAPVVLIPHRRGEDGYFMVQLTPPGSGGPWQRELLPEGEPLELVVLADTSGSIDGPSRSVQGQLLAAMLASLTEKDRFNLAVCDVDVHWAFDKPAVPNASTVAAARQMLSDRASLGWSDLDKAFASVLARSGPKTRVVYLGDGIVTTGDGDPVAFAKRLRRMYEGQPVTFYAVALGSTYEQGVLKTIASLGGGSMRQATGDRGPQAIARELMEELVQPALRDLKVEFRGLRTARVYPAELPNLPAGSQQILLGRYLPEGRDASGEVIVTGTLAGKPVRFSGTVSFNDAEQGNSFIPRLWARLHLDALLEQGSSQAVQDEIIQLSEEYNIITPYTSLLVLESDADRERFKVKTRFRMRDAEKFFAQGRDNVSFDLAQQQMRRAGTWRIGLRRAVLQQLQTLGREAKRPDQTRRRYSGRAGLNGYPSGGFGFGGGEGAYWYRGPAGRDGTMADFDSLIDLTQNTIATESWLDVDSGGVAAYGAPEAWGDKLALGDSQTESDRKAGDEDSSEGLSLAVEKQLNEPLSREEIRQDVDSLYSADMEPAAEPMPFASSSPLMAMVTPRYIVGEEDSEIASPSAFYAGKLGAGKARYSRAQGSGWLNSIFPHLPPAPPKDRPPKQRWPLEARQLAEGLLRTETLARLAQGLRIDGHTEQFDPRWDELTARSDVLALVSPRAWLVRSGGDHGQTTVAWCDAGERGVLSRALQLGRVRPAVPADLSDFPLDLSGYVLHSLEPIFLSYRPEVKPQGDGRVLLVLRDPSNRGFEIHVLVDTARKVMLWMENRQDGKVTSATRFGEFVEVAGAWFAGRIESFDDENRRNSVTTQKFQLLDPAQFDAQRQKDLAGRDQVLLLREPLSKVAGARRAIASGKATFEDHAVLMIYYDQSQQWDAVWEHFEKAQALAAGKPGLRWVRAALLNASRRREAMKQWIGEEATRLARPPAGTQADPEEWHLAVHLLGLTSEALEANELLGLLDALRPIYERRPAHLQAMKQWLQRRAGHLDQAGRPEEALALHKQSAEQYPRDAGLQGDYARRLATAGEYEAAYGWIRRVLAPPARWTPNEQEMLHDVVLDLMEGQERYPEAADYLKTWIATNPKADGPYQRYLGTLLRADRFDECNALVAQWLREIRAAGEPGARLTPDARSRLRAAVIQALGHNYRFYYSDRLDRQWLDPLTELVLHCVRRNVYLDVAGEVMNNGHYHQTDACRRVHREVTKLLRGGLDKLSHEQLQAFVNWIMPDEPAVEKEVWQKIIAALRQRWAREADAEIRHQLGATLVQVLLNRATPEEAIEFLRKEWLEGPEPYRVAYARDLFARLLDAPWSEGHENEALGLLEKLTEEENPARRLAVAVSALERLTDRMVQARLAARMKAVEHPEKLPRTDLAAKRQENLRLAREGFADALRLHGRKAPAGLAAWMTIERMYLDVLAGRALQKVEEECREHLGERVRRLPGEEKGEVERALEARLGNRHLMTLLNLSARRTATPAAADRTLAYLDRAIAAEPEELYWKLAKMQLLVALDRPKDLAKDLGTWLDTWLNTAGPANPWRQPLAFLLAEQGKLPEAIKLLEAMRTQGQLGPSDHRALANWYMAVNRREDYDRAMVDSYRTVDDWRLSNWLRAKLNPWQRTNVPLPGELDKEVLWAFGALLEKSGQPQQYVHQLQESYAATRDFRLLACLADAVVGHTAGRVYPFLESLGPVLQEVQDEATVDSLVEHVGKVRRRAKTPVDRRALDLLEVLIERRAAELKNQPGPHADRAVAALQRAGKPAWTPGEPRLMAGLLAGLGRIAHPGLAELQVKLLEELHRQAGAGTLDRLAIASSLATCRSNYGKRPEAIDLMENALREHLEAAGGTLPATANFALELLVGLLEQERHFARGEKLLQEQLARPANAQQRFWLVQRLYRLYREAIQGEGAVSLGSGQALYQEVNRRIQAAMDHRDANHRRALIGELTAIYRAAAERKLAGVAGDLRQFAFKRFAQVVAAHEGSDNDVVRETAQTLHDLASPRDGLAFLVERFEKEPRWRQLTGDDGWQRHAYMLAQWRVDAGALGDLDGRLLAIVTAELRRDLESRQARNRIIYYRHDSHFWAAKTEAFARVADEVAAENKQSSVTLTYVADYLFRGLERHGRAIEILQDAHRREVLDEDGQSRLVRFLEERNRDAESIPILEPLVQRRPDNVQYRVGLMHAYSRTQQREKLISTLKQADAYFHQENRWQEGVIAALAHGCIEPGLFEQVVAYYKELIPLHQRTQPNQGIGNGTLSGYYSDLALACSRLGKTAEAVDAVCGAIVSWPSGHVQRSRLLDRLQEVLRESPDLDGYVRQLDKKAADEKRDNPHVRKAAGLAYMAKNQPAKAIPQLELACELVPNDAQTYRTLVAAYDATRDREGAIRQLLRQAAFARRDVKLYEELANRYLAIGAPGEAERANTAIVEALPSESESHALLAEIRQRQNRWPEAIVQWHEVARIRALEPTGLMKLAEAQVHERQWDSALRTLRTLDTRSWPSRFGDVHGEVRNLERQIEAGRKGP